MEPYEVTKGCYVPVGTGSRYKHPGQLVWLDGYDAEELSGFVKKASRAKLKREGRSEVNTPEEDAPSAAAVISTETAQVISENSTPEETWEVTPDAGEQAPDYEGTAAEAVE